MSSSWTRCAAWRVVCASVRCVGSRRVQQRRLKAKVIARAVRCAEAWERDARPGSPYSRRQLQRSAARPANQPARLPAYLPACQPLPAPSSPPLIAHTPTRASARAARQPACTSQRAILSAEPELYHMRLNRALCRLCGRRAVFSLKPRTAAVTFGAAPSGRWPVAPYQRSAGWSTLNSSACCVARSAVCAVRLCVVTRCSCRHRRCKSTRCVWLGPLFLSTAAIETKRHRNERGADIRRCRH